MDDIIDITNENISDYIMQYGANDLMTSMATGVHILLLTKKKHFVGNGFMLMTRSKDKLSVSSDEAITILPSKRCKIDSLLILSSDGKFSLSAKVLSYGINLFPPSLHCLFNNVYVEKGGPVVLEQLNFSF